MHWTCQYSSRLGVTAPYIWAIKLEILVSTRAQGWNGRIDGVLNDVFNEWCWVFAFSTPGNCFEYRCSAASLSMILPLAGTWLSFGGLFKKNSFFCEPEYHLACIELFLKVHLHWGLNTYYQIQWSKKRWQVWFIFHLKWRLGLWKSWGYRKDSGRWLCFVKSGKKCLLVNRRANDFVELVGGLCIVDSEHSSVTVASLSYFGCVYIDMRFDFTIQNDSYCVMENNCSWSQLGQM